MMSSATVLETTLHQLQTDTMRLGISLSIIIGQHMDGIFLNGSTVQHFGCNEIYKIFIPCGVG